MRQNVYSVGQVNTYIKNMFGQDYLLNQIRDRQIFITCCDPNTIKSLKGGTAFYVESGVVTKK